MLLMSTTVRHCFGQYMRNIVLLQKFFFPRDNTDIFLCFEVQGNNDFILITARIWHKYYSKFSTQILLEGFDTHITARIRHRYYSKYSTQILQQEFVTNIIASFRHKYYSKYSTQILQKVFDTNITVSIRYKYYSKYSTQILQL
jgi:hypothetical protein